MKLYCDKCEKPIKHGQHHFTVTSHHPESFNSWDDSVKEYHVDCIKDINLVKQFDWHIKGEY